MHSLAIKKIIHSSATLAMISLVLLLAGALPLRAAEINPAPGSYSYGSTSEFANYAGYTIGTPSDSGGNLASTGHSRFMFILLALGLVSLALTLSIRRYRRSW